MLTPNSSEPSSTPPTWQITLPQHHSVKEQPIADVSTIYCTCLDIGEVRQCARNPSEASSKSPYNQDQYRKMVEMSDTSDMDSFCTMDGQGRRDQTMSDEAFV